MEKTFKDYKRQLVLSKGKQDINGKSYEVSEDLYALVPQTQEGQPSLSVQDGRVSLLTESGYLPNLAGVKVEETQALFGIGRQENQNVDSAHKGLRFNSKLFILLGLLLIGILGLLILLLKSNKQHKD